MLQAVTSHCPQGHALVKNATDRTKKISAGDVLDVTTVGWCDVCIEPFDGSEERWTCSECYYDCCWKCHEEGREAYYFCMEFAEDSPLAYEPIYGTVDVLKGRISKSDLANASETEIVAKGAVFTFDCDLYDLTFGADKEELRQIRTSSTVTFDRASGGMKSFSCSYENITPEKDLKVWGRTINTFAVNDLFSDVPEAIKTSGNWAGCNVSTVDEPALPTMFATVTFSRFGLVEVPGFGMPEDKQGKTLKLLREIARDKRGIINPMRKKHATIGASAMICLPSLWRASEMDPAANLIKKKKDEDRGNKIIDQLELNQSEVAYQEISSTGKVNHRDLIYASRLSLLAYLIDRVPFGFFYSADREKYLLDPVWVNFIEHVEQNEGRELLRQWLGMSKQKQRKLEDHAHEAFLAKFIANFFVTDPNSDEFGLSLHLNSEEGPLHALGLEYGQLYPDRPPEKRGVIQMGGTEMFVAVSNDLKEEGGDICLVFQGTNDFRDLLVNFNGVTTPFEPLVDGPDAGWFGCLQGRLIADGDESVTSNTRRVHLGFYNAFLKLRDVLDKFLRETLASIPKDKNVRIVVTGHSLGGALATVCTGWLFQLFDEEYKSTSAKYPTIKGEITGEASDRLRILSVTFGSPKVGNHEFVEWLDDHRFMKKSAKDGAVRAKILRLIDVMDPIVTLPPSAGGFTYRHTARKGATVSRAGDMVFISRESADRYDETTRGLGVIAKRGMAAAQNHDLFLYMHKCLHFAWVFNDVTGDENADWDENPLERAFGASTYRYDKFTKSDEFRTNF